MAAGVLIITFSLLLLAYWFRYSCLMLLRDRAAEPGVFDQRFGFTPVEEQLQTAADLSALHEIVGRDYRLLTYLWEHAAGLNLDSLEDRLLLLDYKLVEWYYRLMKTSAPAQARRALGEMAAVVGVLAQRMSEQAGGHARA